MRNTLGISLKVKHVGLAVLAEGELVEFRVRTFYGAWTEEKQNDILRTIKKTVSRYQIGAIQVKAPKSSHCSDGILAILRGIEWLAQELKVRIGFCTIADLMMQYGESGLKSKRQLIHAICRKFPQNKQLVYLCEKERISKNAYHVKVFEAIACAELAAKTER